MAVHYLSGTTKYDMQQVGATDSEIGNIFKKFAHSMEVNFKNVQKGQKVNANNLVNDIHNGAKHFEHAMAVNVHNVPKALKDVKAAAIKVSAVAVRKAFLGLVALNVHNFAKDLDIARHNPKELKDVKYRWEHELGGSWKVLDQAINNGKGRHRIFGYNQIGVVTVAAMGAWLALAATAIGILAPFLKSANKKEIAGQSQEAVAGLLANTYNAATGGKAATDALNNLLPQSNAGSMAITPGVTASGAPELTIHDIDSPVLNAATKPNKDDGSMDLDDSSIDNGENDAINKTGKSSFDKFMQSVEDTWQKHKKPILIVVGSVTAVAIIGKYVVPVIRKRRK